MTRQCHECGADYLDGALFCDECGARLAEGDGVLLTPEIPSVATTAGEKPAHPPDCPLGFGTKTDRIVFIVSSTGRRHAVELGDEILIGRVDSRQNIWPEIDLTLDNGAEGGVSRRHAHVRQSDEGVILVDLGSTNGTQVNDWPLTPQQPYLLRNGDSVRFGQLLVQIYFAT